MKNIISTFLFSITTIGLFSQFNQMNIAAKVISQFQNNANMLYQSMDGTSTCEGRIEFMKTNQEMSQITLTFISCEGVITSVNEKIVLTKIQQTDQKFLFADNDQYSARFLSEGGNYKLEKLISKTESNKMTYNFNYPVQNINPAKQSINTNEPKKEVKNTNPALSSSSDRTYLVQEGDYIYKIARNTNCSPTYLMKINNIKDSDILYPGTTITICSESNYMPTAAQNKPKTNSKTPFGNDLSKINTDYESLRVQMENSAKEILSLKTYGEELRKDYELLIKEFNELNASYQNLIAEYKETVEDNKSLRTENERLKQLLKERNINPENELTADEKQKVDALQQQIQSVRSQISDMKTKIDEAQATKTEEPAKPEASAEVQKTEPAQPLVPVYDPKFDEFCQVIVNRVIKDEKTTRLHVERILSYKIQDEKVKEITAVSTNELKHNKIDSKKKVGDYIQTLDIFALMNLQYPSFKTSNEYINTKLYTDIQKTNYTISVGKKDFKVKKSSRDISSMKNNDPHFALIKEDLKKNKIQEGTLEIIVIDQQVNLEYENEQKQFETLHKYSNSSIVKQTK